MDDEGRQDDTDEDKVVDEIGILDADRDKEHVHSEKRRKDHPKGAHLIIDIVFVTQF